MSSIFSDIYNKKIAIEGDNNSYTYEFELPLLIGEIDMTSLMYKLDIEKSDKTLDICELDKEVLTDKVVLTWTITSDITDVSGTMRIQIRAINEDSSIVWHSSISKVIISESINSSEKYMEINPIEFEEIEARISVMKEETEILANNAKTAEENIISISEEISQTAQNIEKYKNEVATNTETTSNNTDLVIEKAEFTSDEADRATNAMLNGIYTHNSSTASHPSILSELEDVKLIAQGASQSVTFADYESLIENINSLGDDEYSVGRNFNIVTVGVPDLWISAVNETYVEYTYTSDDTITAEIEDNEFIQIGYYSFSMLETQKIDLTNIYTKDEVDNLVPKFVTESWYNEQYSEGTLPTGVYFISGDEDD